MDSKTRHKSESILSIGLLVLIAGMTYLWRIWQIGYLNDDWYLMYSARAYGPGAFLDIFSVDRPARAWVMAPAYSLFGDNSLYYNLSALFFRLVAALAFLWLLRMIWPRQRSATWLATLLFLIYPGFLSQLNGIDYQSQMVALAAALFSIAFSVRASMMTKLLNRFVLIAGAVLLGWLYLGLVEYFLGFEILRILGLYVIVSREQASIKEKSLLTLRKWLPNVTIPAVFLIWRVFFFQAERDATDINLQLETFSLSPLVTGLWWLARLIQDALDVLFGAWVIPLYQLFDLMRLRDVLLAFGLTALASFLTLWAVRRAGKESNTDTDSPNWRIEMFWFGLIVVFAGLVPVTLTNRQVDFTNYTRYALASSTGGALVLTALLYLLSSQQIRQVLFCIMIGIAILTHHANSIKAAQGTSALRTFWWQVRWRVPQIESGTTLVAHYPVGGTAEDYFVWGPANLIYHPEKGNEEHIQPSLYAMVLNREALSDVLTRQRQDFDSRKTIVTYPNPRNLLILTQPNSASCVRVLDGNQIELSSAEPVNIMLASPYSEIEHVLLESTAPVPSEIVFGSEPPHGWCYYYEKAALARQRGDWESISDLGEEAQSRGFYPADPIEWMPFLQAFAVRADTNQLNGTAAHIKDPYVLIQACQILSGMDGLTAETLIQIQSMFCIAS